ncbi:beta-lactam-binding protein with PASTA domain [Thermonema lapsum]|uniref:Beta-lactam-binding protein with PASTA domain n=1 Tax=Thermonema lapsum TaxID=28195 RepID=A0A846MP78_9BACT|nr:PASTA domain-containing protein [Thermonema lapsum]NIK73366.1 beta-lactam-binding protein with PASTA domain [Thermonema lapsum]
MKFWIKTNSVKQVVIHLLLAAISFILLLVLFFFYFIPYIARQDEVTEVPRLTGASIDSVLAISDALPVEIIIQDSSFSTDYKPGTILSQYPLPGTQVKPGRKVYLTICPKEPPMTEMPKLTGISYPTAIAKLKSSQLQLGRIRFEPDIAIDIVLEQEIDGKPVPPGTPIKMGTKVDLVVGSGIGEEEFDVPDLTGLTLEEAETVLKERSLRLGIVRYDENAQAPYRRIFKQNPAAFVDLSQYELAGYDKHGKPIYRPIKVRSDSLFADGSHSKSLNLSKVPRNKIRPGEMIDVWVSNNPTYSVFNDTISVMMNEMQPIDSLIKKGGNRKK